MGIEQRSNAVDESLFTRAQILHDAGKSNDPKAMGRLKREIDRDVGLTPQTDSNGRELYPQADHDRLVGFMQEPENNSLRADFESAILPDGNQITGTKTSHIRQITEIVTQARKEQQPFSLEQIAQALDPTPKRSKESKATARKKVYIKIESYRKKIKPHGWVIDAIPLIKGSEEGTSRQYWFRHKDEPQFAHPLDTKALAKKDILLPNGRIIKVDRDTLETRAIKGALLAQENGTPYLAGEIAALGVSPFNNRDGESSVNLVVKRANIILRKNDCILVEYEAEVNGKKVRAFRIEEKPAPTSSPESQSPANGDRF
ncbi:MAG: hypothetical protein HYW62_01785 [Candidatus Levybacteria bacterium]|nr:hypothetical protein [Candidatus Levybacteria bacterium]